jgi:hypothetical protein
MEIGLPPEDSFREQPESLDDAAGWNLDMASDAGALENAATLIRLRIAIGPAVAQGAVLAADGPEDLRTVTDAIRQGEGSSAQKTRPVADLDQITCLSLEGEAAFLADLGRSSNCDRSARGNKSAPREKLRVIADSDGPVLSDLKDDSGP